MQKALVIIFCIFLCSCSYGTGRKIQPLSWHENYAMGIDDLMDPASIPHLIEATHDLNQRIQINALEALGDLRPHSISAIPRAMEMIRSKENPRVVKIAAVDFFFQLGAFVKGKVGELGDLLNSEKDQEIRVHLIHALGSIGSHQAFPFLEKIKAQEDERLRWAADLAIERIRSFDIVDFCEEKTIEAIKEAPTFSYTDTEEPDGITVEDSADKPLPTAPQPSLK